MKLHYSFLYYAYHTNEVVNPLPMDTLDFHDITLCLSGKMHYKINGKDVVAQKGDILYTSYGDKRQRFANHEENNTFVSINLLGDTEKMLDQPYYSNFVNKRCLTLVEEIEHAFTFGEKQTICLLTLLLVQEIQKQQLFIQEDPRVLRIKNYILNNIYEKLTVSMIADHIGYTSIYCNTLFKQHTGKTIIDFINESKISVAQSYLKSSTITLNNLALKLNFSSYNYFSRCFKKIVGISPKKYVMMFKQPHS